MVHLKWMMRWWHRQQQRRRHELELLLPNWNLLGQHKAQSTKHNNNIIKLTFSLYFQYIQLWKIVTAFLKESKHILLINCSTLLAAALLCASPVSLVIQSIYFAIHEIWFANCVLERSLECIHCTHKNVSKCESFWAKELLDPFNLLANS